MKTQGGDGHAPAKERDLRRNSSADTFTSPPEEQENEFVSL